MNINDLKEYYTELDSVDRQMIDNKVAEKGIEGYLNQQLIYLDCSRIIKGLRMMQTIGYPYKREISSYLYAVSGLAEDPNYEQEWINKLLELHEANLKYEESNPPIVYDELKPKKSTSRKRKVKEGDIFPEEVKPKISKKEQKIQNKIKALGFGGFKLNLK